MQNSFSVADAKGALILEGTAHLIAGIISQSKSAEEATIELDLLANLLIKFTKESKKAHGGC